ncbi:hypothetical protein MANES_01G042900v8 [Manihot esculenta]|uniref:Uncharacterized protein n=1 Tax=Manihot esculenta TaxID=3983 RepID=A0A2C9WHL8_MANES|nr:hypothetical protein MANES_01G042900v8 [Manihot esculenta]
MGFLSVAVPTVVAAAGIYFLEKSHSRAQEVGNGIQAAAIANMVRKVKEQVKTNTELPKLAPQFDGLFCFETFIGH